jgi:hypothetical protein
MEPMHAIEHSACHDLDASHESPMGIPLKWYRISMSLSGARQIGLDAPPTASFSLNANLLHVS